MNYEDIKRHFESSPPPREVRWTPWASITDTQIFLKSCYTTIRNYNGPVERCPAWWHLRDFYILMKKASPQAASAEENALEESALEENTAEEKAEKTAYDEAVSKDEIDAAV